MFKIVISCLNWKGKDIGDMNDKLLIEIWKVCDYENSEVLFFFFFICVNLVFVM